MPQSSQDPIFSLRSLTCDCIIPAVAIAVDDEKSQSCQLVLTVKWEKGNGSSYLALCYTQAGPNRGVETVIPEPAIWNDLADTEPF